MQDLIRTKRFLDEISGCIRGVILRSFPGLAGQEQEDVEQEVKLKLWKMVRRGKEIRNIKSYLGRMVYTVALDIIEERMSYVPIDSLAGEDRSPEFADRVGPGPEALAERGQMNDRIRTAVESLPERRRTVLKLHFSGEGIDQMANRLGWSSNRVRHLLYRGLGDVRRRLSEERPRPRP